MSDFGTRNSWEPPGPPGALAPPPDSPPGTRIFCAACGAGASADEQYCVACGRQLRLPDLPSSGEDSAASSLRRAHHLLVTGCIREAIPLLERLNAEHPKWTAVRAYLGVAYLRAARVIEAQRAIEEALQLTPDNFTCRMAYAEYFARLGFYDKAVLQLDQALALAEPGDEAYRAAFELRRFCHEKSKGLFYRKTALPRLPAALRRWRHGADPGTNRSTAVQARST